MATSDKTAFGNRPGGGSPPAKASIGERHRGGPAARAVAALIAILCGSATAGVLPEDRADILYHYYDGGGVQIDGPSILARKKIGQSVSLSANYYVDTVSSASIDVVSRASPYSEERTEYSLGAEYLRGDTTLSLAVTSSDENDYQADTLNLGIAQEVFGGLTTVSMGYTRGSDDVGMRGSSQTWMADHWRYRVGISQVVTRNLLMSLDYEAIGDEGLLNNPYREVRYVDAGNPAGYDFQPEVYPNTRDSNAVALRARYYLPYRAAVSAGYRWFTDSWGIGASTWELGYTHPHQRWTWDIAWRYYTQDAADFYSDLFPYVDAQNFLARDKELSTFRSHAIRLGVGYELPLDLFDVIERGAVNLVYDRLMFSYDDFRDVRASAPAGQEPLYQFDANVVQLFFSVWF